MTQDREARIRERAHTIWEREGRPDGMADVHWIQACREIEEEERASPVSASAETPRRKRRKAGGGTPLVTAAKSLAQTAAQSVSATVSAGVEAITETAGRVIEPKRRPRASAARVEKAPGASAKRSKAVWTPADIQKAPSAPKRPRSVAGPENKPVTTDTSGSTAAEFRSSGTRSKKPRSAAEAH